MKIDRSLQIKGKIEEVKVIFMLELGKSYGIGWGVKGRRDKLGCVYMWILFFVYWYFGQRVMMLLEDVEF